MKAYPEPGVVSIGLKIKPRTVDSFAQVAASMMDIALIYGAFMAYEGIRAEEKMSEDTNVCLDSGNESDTIGPYER